MYRDAVSKALQGRPRPGTHGWEHNGQPQASMDDNRRKAFMYSTNFRISKKYNLFRNRPVIYNLICMKLSYKNMILDPKAVSYSSQILKVKFFTLDDDELVDPSFQN